MDDLIAFLNERLAEDERIATAARDEPESDWWWSEDAESAPERHIARHDPARVLADVAAKRAIVEMHAREGEDCAICCGEEYIEEHWDGEEETVEHVREPAPYPCRTLLLVASIYAEHPDFKADWRPA